MTAVLGFRLTYTSDFDWGFNLFDKSHIITPNDTCCLQDNSQEPFELVVKKRNQSLQLISDSTLTNIPSNFSKRISSIGNWLGTEDRQLGSYCQKKLNEVEKVVEMWAGVKWM